MKARLTQKNNPTLTSMRMFHKSQDWIILWEEFFLKIDKSGRPLYRSVAQFARVKAENALQKEFLKWYLGSKNADLELDKKYSWIQPVDWIHRRETGGWYTDEAVKQATKEVNSKQDALQALREAGKVPLRFLYGLDKLSQKLDEAFMGELFLPDKTEIENLARVENYFNLKRKVLEMVANAHELHTKSLGIDFNNPESLVQMLSVSVTNNNRVSGPSRLEQAVNEITQMAMIKAGKYGTPLPAEITGKVIDIKAEVDKKITKQ